MNRIGNEWGYLSKVKLFETVIPICPPACDTYNYSSGAVKKAFSKLKKSNIAKMIEGMIQMTRHYSRWALPPSLSPWSSPCLLLFTFSVGDDDDETMQWNWLLTTNGSGPPSSTKQCLPHLLLVVVWFFIHHWSHPIFTTEQVVPVNIYPPQPLHTFYHLRLVIKIEKT